MKTIVIDPGHGGKGNLTSIGAVGNGLVEKDLNLELSRHLRNNLLTYYDCKVVMTRDGDYDVSFSDRADVARKNDADLLISVHFNGFYDPQANGFESFVYSGALQQNTINYQHAIHNEVYKLLNEHGMRDRGKKRANFAVLRMPPCSCVLLEYCFLSNPSDAAVFKKPNMIREAAIATATGIAKALSLQKKKIEPVNPVEPEDNVLYRVVVGSYQHRGNAERALQEAQNKGYKDAFIAIYEL